LGIIIKESAKQTVVRIGLSVLGALATLFIYPLSRELYGILGFVLDTSLLLVPMVLVGLGESSIKFFPFKNTDHKTRSEFFTSLTKMLILNVFVVCVLFFLFKDVLISWSDNPSNDYSKYFIYALPIAICFGITQFFVQYISNYKIVTLPIIIQGLYRIGMPLAFILVFYNLTDNIGGIHFMLGSLVLSVVIMAVYAVRALLKHKPDTTAKTEPLSKRTFYSFYFWAFAGSLGSLMAFKIDGFMVPALTNFEAGADYRISVFIASIIALPITSVVTISSPILSQAWKDLNMEEIKTVYLTGAKNLVYIGAVMLLGMLLLVDLLPQVLNSWAGLTHLKVLVIIIGFAKLIDMTAGVNGVIIQHSPWYRYNTIFVLIMMVINVILNLIFIKKFGIVGAATATAISLIVFNVLKAILLQNKIKLNPFDKSTLLFLLYFSLVVAIMQYTMNTFDFPLAFTLNIMLTLVFAVVFLFYTELAIETRGAILKMYKKFVR